MNYLLAGPEEYTKSRFIEKLKKETLGRPGAELDFSVFTAGDSDISRILGTLRSLPFASRKRLVLIRDIGKFSSKEKDSLLKYLETPRASTILVMDSVSPVKNKFLDSLRSRAKLVECRKINGGDVAQWIISEFAKYKKRISRENAFLLKERAGESIRLLKNEVEKIVSFAGNSEEITDKHLEPLLGNSFPKTAFQLVDMVLDKRVDGILAYLDGLLAGEKPHQVLNILAWQFRNFLKIKKIKNFSPREAARVLGVSWHSAKRLSGQAGRFTLSDIERNLDIILEADFFMKSGRMDAERALERAVLGLCR